MIKNLLIVLTQMEEKNPGVFFCLRYLRFGSPVLLSCSLYDRRLHFGTWGRTASVEFSFVKENNNRREKGKHWLTKSTL